MFHIHSFASLRGITERVQMQSKEDFYQLPVIDIIDTKTHLTGSSHDEWLNAAIRLRPSFDVFSKAKRVGSPTEARQVR